MWTSRSGGIWIRFSALPAVAVALLAQPARAEGAVRVDSFQTRLEVAVRRHVLPREEAAQLDRALGKAEQARLLLAPDRARMFGAVCAGAEQAALPLNQVRARVLTETLDVNGAFFARAPVRDARAASGVVYRRYGDGGYQFQPLASFADVNAMVQAGQLRRARRLAQALLARAEHREDALVWKYYFRLYGSWPRWSSGLTQAVAAQALARVGLVRPARAAFAAIRPRLLIELRQGPWVRLYSFSSTVVLNAQLQAVISLRQYALIAHDPEALRLANRLARSALQLLPAFDTGWWSRYQLGGGTAPLDYHRYVTSLLWKLGHDLGGERWLRQARRFSADWRQPPRLSIRQSPAPVYLRSPGRQGVARIVVSLSKPATLTIRIGSSSSTGWRSAGSHLILWRPGAHTTAAVAATISATDYAGNHADASSAPFEIRRDTTPPQVRAELVGDLLFWRAHDGLSPHLRGLVLYGDHERAIRLPHMRDAGALAVAVGRQPPAWLIVADSSGNTTRIRLTRSSARPPSRPAALAPLPARPNEILVWIR